MLLAERYTLGMILREPGNLDAALNAGVRVEHFQTPAFREVFATVMKCNADGRPFDLANLTAELPMGTLVEVSRQTADAPFTDNVAYYARRLVDAAWVQKLRAESVELSSAAMNWSEGIDTTALKSMAFSIADRLEDASKTSSEVEASQLADDFMTYLAEKEERLRRTGSLAVKTGFDRLDRLTTGWENGHFYVLGARPSVGKTTIGLEFTLNAAFEGMPSVFISTEMSPVQLTGKFYSRIGKIDYERMRNLDLTEDHRNQLKYARMVFKDLPLTIVDKTDRSFETMAQQIRSLHRRGKCGFVVIDYVQQLYIDGERAEDRTQSLTHITSQLKALARSLNIPILGLAQLNRTVKDDEPPQMSQLKGSGSFEQDADTVLLLHRDGPAFNPNGYFLIIAKQREGRLEMIPLGWNLATNSFWEKKD